MIFSLREGLCLVIIKLSLIERSRGEKEKEMIIKSSGEVVWSVDLVWDKTPDK